MHAPWANRLFVALVEVQKTLARAANKLTKRPRLRVVSHDEPANGEFSDPVLALLAAAPIDDEPVSADDRRHIAEGWKAYREGRMVPEEGAVQECLEANEGESSQVKGREKPD
jgi:hypothetical protein